MGKIVAALSFILLALSPCFAYGSPPKLIHLGWDSPSLVDLSGGAAPFDHSPFDGIIFWIPVAKSKSESVDLRTLVWSKEKISTALEVELKSSLDRLRERGSAYHFLRVGVTPGDVDWFDDGEWDGVLHNFALAARLARRAGARGLFFDTEQYRSHLFSFNSASGSPTRSWDEVTTQVRTRGGELVRAIEREYPGLEIIFSYAYSAVAEWTGRDPLALRAHEYALLPPFLDGILRESSPGVRLIDGYENSYSYRAPEEFANAALRIRTLGAATSEEPLRYLKRFEIGFGIWLDYRSNERVWQGGAPTKNYRTPNDFKETVSGALKNSESYVWIYSERVSWWGDASFPPVPAAYRDALRRGAAFPMSSVGEDSKVTSPTSTPNLYSSPFQQPLRRG